MITINFGRPRVSVRKDGEGEGPDLIEKAEALFTTRNFILVMGGISLGIILKQQSDIRVLKRTVEYLQGAIR